MLLHQTPRTLSWQLLFAGDIDKKFGAGSGGRE